MQSLSTGILHAVVSRDRRIQGYWADPGMNARRVPSASRRVVSSHDPPRERGRENQEMESGRAQPDNSCVNGNNCLVQCRFCTARPLNCWCDGCPCRAFWIFIGSQQWTCFCTGRPRRNNVMSWPSAQFCWSCGYGHGYLLYSVRTDSHLAGRGYGSTACREMCRGRRIAPGERGRMSTHGRL